MLNVVPMTPPITRTTFKGAEKNAVSFSARNQGSELHNSRDSYQFST